ncbi:MAG TPA: hypothetical protein VMM38_15260 [Aridibacter sp.]|nr:hypothetical protein [Aridibacter sp.]
MLRAVILAMVVLVAIGMMIPVATEQTEAGAKEQARQYQKKNRAEKFRYRTRFRLASYSKSERFKRSAVLLAADEPEKRPEIKLPESAADSVFTEPAPKLEKVRRTRSAKSTVRSVKTKRANRSTSKAGTKVRYKKVRRFKANSSKSKSRSARRNASVNSRTVRTSKRKYTARWWHNYRAQKLQESALAKRKAAMRARREMLQRQHAAAQEYAFVEQAESRAAETENANQEITQLVIDSDGTVTMVVVGPAVGDTVDFGRRRTLAGVSTTALRRTVIDQMIRENGWVENDYHKDVDGKKVYVVVAKAPDDKNRIRAKTFYFTESQGNIYRIAASAPKEQTEEAALKSEQMVKSLQQEKRPQQAKKEPVEKE